MLAAAIAFWGWQTTQWLVAVPVAALLCASFYGSLRWPLTTAQLTRVADFCMVLGLLIGVLFYFSYGNPIAVILFFKWLPLMFLPLALAYAYSDTGHTRMNLSVLFWSLRRRPADTPATFDPWWPYFALWIIAASAANERGEWFYVGLAALVSWPLVRNRPWSYRVGSWGVAFSIAIGLGYALHSGLHYTQAWLEAAVPEWISGDGSRTDPYRATTDIGHIGKLKESDSIVLRVMTPGDAKPPALLHRASYNTYFAAAWLARGSTFHSVRSTAPEAWPLAASNAIPARVTIHDYSARPNPLLSLPAGTHTIEALKAITLQRNALGAVQIVREPGYFSYVAAYAGEQAFEGPPTAQDTRVSPKEHDAYAAVATELGLTPQRGDDAVAAVKNFFALGYRYATFQKDAPQIGSEMVDFLHRSKSGHCEYFATATVLLLRAGGIPARYATGFAVIENSERENAWLVRTRHAHAWARAYVNGAWIDIDTTPSSWSMVEAEGSGSLSKAWAKVTDVGSWLRFRAAQAWARSDERKLWMGALIVMLPFALWLAWRLVRSKRSAKIIEQNQLVTTMRPVGNDSPFYRIEQRLAQQGWGRGAHETAHDWLNRLNTEAKIDTTTLAEIIALHYRYRFDPAGLDAAQRTQLNDAARVWLTDNALTPS